MAPTREKGGGYYLGARAGRGCVADRARLTPLRLTQSQSRRLVGAVKCGSGSPHSGSVAYSA